MYRLGLHHCVLGQDTLLSPQAWGNLRLDLLLQLTSIPYILGEVEIFLVALCWEQDKRWLYGPLGPMLTLSKVNHCTVCEVTRVPRSYSSHRVTRIDDNDELELYFKFLIWDFNMFCKMFLWEA